MPRAGIGIEPDHAPVGCEPLDAVMQSAARIGEGAIDVRKAAGMSAADLRQDAL
jgi:hypothetical protein